MMNRIRIAFLSMLLLIGIFCSSVLAMPNQYGSGFEDREIDVTLMEEPATDLSCFDNFTPRALKAGETLRKGVDVSYYQGDIDWQKLADSGIEFVFVRAAYRAWGSGVLYKDEYYARNIERAHKAGLKVGTYIYSQATTKEEAVEEAEFILDLVGKYSLELPVVLDFEYACNKLGLPAGRLYEAKLTKQQATDVCNAFCKRVAETQYTPMVYANLSMLNDSLYATKLNAGVWLANFTKKTSYTGDYDFWQCSESGKVPGISGGVDINFWFDDGTFGTSSGGGSGSTEPEPNALPFTDVSPEDWSYDSICYCYQKGIIYGMTETEFAPKQYTTRGQLVTMLYRVDGKPAVSGETPFTDLTLDYYRTPILWAWKTGIVRGTSDTTFEPDRFITRQDLITILYRYAGSPAASGNLSGYSDAGQVSPYAVQPMVWAVKNGIVHGTSATTLSPLNCATREEIAALIARLMQQTQS